MNPLNEYVGPVVLTCFGIATVAFLIFIVMVWRVLIPDDFPLRLGLRVGPLRLSVFWSWKNRFEVSKTEYNARTAYVLWIFAIDIARKTDEHFFRLKPTKAKNFKFGFEVTISKIR